MPCAPRSPLSRIASPGAMRDGRIAGPWTTPMPDVLMYTPSPLPRSTTFVSPVTMGTPARAAASLIAATTRFSVSMERPSSRMKPALSASARAPHIARSFTVP